MNVTAGSPQWQVAMLGLALLFLFYETWRGWKDGFVRGLLKLVALVGSVMLGFAAARVVALPLGGIERPLGMVVGAVAGLGVAVIVVLAAWLASMLLFKKTSHQPPGMVRFFWGLGGSILGLAVGVVILLSVVSMIRGFGTLAEVRMEQTAKATREQRAAVHAYPSKSNSVQPPNAFFESLAKAKNSMEMGPMGRTVAAADPVSAATYQGIAQTYEVFIQLQGIIKDPEAMQRFLEFPQVKEVTQSPELAKILQDPTVIKACENRDFAALLRNPALIKALQNPDLEAKVRQVDLAAALKFALAKPTPSPAPSQP